MSADITNIQKTEEDRNVKPATIVTDESKVVENSPANEALGAKLTDSCSSQSAQRIKS